VHQVERGAAVGTTDVGQGEGARGVCVRQAADRRQDERDRAVDRVFGTPGHGRKVAAAPHRPVDRSYTFSHASRLPPARHMDDSASQMGRTDLVRSRAYRIEAPVTIVTFTSV
jgi:hypothetical protein